MQNTTTSSTSSLPTLQRLLIAFLLGLPVGLMSYFFQPAVNAPGIYSLWWLPVAILILAALLSIILDSNVRQGIVSPGRVIAGVIVVLVLSAIMIAVELWLLGLLQNPTANASLNTINLALIPLFVSLTIAFAVGSSNGLGLALGVGFVGWFAAALHFVIFAIIVYIVNNQGSTDEGIALPLTIAWVLLAFLVAAIGSLLGRLLRKGVLGE